jgi:hypothetical protein
MFRLKLGNVQNAHLRVKKSPITARQSWSLSFMKRLPINDYSRFFLRIMDSILGELGGLTIQVLYTPANLHLQTYRCFDFRPYTI